MPHLTCSSFSGETVKDLGLDSLFPWFVDLAIISLFVTSTDTQSYGPPPGLPQRSNKEERVNQGHLKLPDGDALVSVCGCEGQGR